jgi:glycine/sarcosine/betaine reductase complex component A
MDLGSQEKIKKLADEHDRDELLVVLGAPDAEAAEIAAETIVLGDPTYAGALAETQLGLDVYHVLENEIQSEIPDDVWEDQIGVMADTLEAESLAEAVGNMRAKAGEEAS